MEIETETPALEMNVEDLIKSPVQEANAQDSLTELFERDPMQLSDQDVDRIVVELRKARVNWEQDEKKKAVTKSSPKKSAPAQLSLADLDLNLG